MNKGRSHEEWCSLPHSNVTLYMWLILVTNGILKTNYQNRYTPKWSIQTKEQKSKYQNRYAQMEYQTKYAQSSKRNQIITMSTDKSVIHNGHWSSLNYNIQIIHQKSNKYLNTSNPIPVINTRPTRSCPDEHFSHLVFV